MYTGQKENQNIFEQFKNCIYYDTEIMLDEVNSGPVYEKVKKKIKKYGKNAKNT